MDRITICDLAVLYRVGVPEEERAVPQRLLLTIEMSANFSAAAASDDLSQTIDYYAVTQRLLRFGEGRSWKLLETLAVDMTAMLLQEFKPKNVVVEIKKFIIPETRYISAKVERERQE